MIEVSHADRVVFPEIGRTKGDVVAYFERVAGRALPHLLRRPLSIRRYPKGLDGPGFFQKNVPAHYPASMERFAVPRSAQATKRHRGKAAAPVREETEYPVLTLAEHLPYLANQGAIELHVPTARLPDLLRPDRVVIDLDPPPDSLVLVRRAAIVVRDRMGELGLPTVPVATGSKGYHVVAPIAPPATTDDGLAIGTAVQKLAALLVAEQPDDLTVTFRVAQRGGRVFVDWLRNMPMATVVAPYSLRARPRATVAVPLAWSEIETIPPDGFTIADVARLLDRPDHLADLARTPAAPEPFVAAVDAAFERAGLVLEEFDRFRS
ncbi:MAG TPA: non-homologous end-joining DNA ligase [Polyangiaceae bacterium]